MRILVFALALSACGSNSSQEDRSRSEVATEHTGIASRTRTFTASELSEIATKLTGIARAKGKELSVAQREALFRRCAQTPRSIPGPLAHDVPETLNGRTLGAAQRELLGRRSQAEVDEFVRLANTTHHEFARVQTDTISAEDLDDIWGDLALVCHRAIFMKKEP